VIKVAKDERVRVVRGLHQKVLNRPLKCATVWEAGKRIFLILDALIRHDSESEGRQEGQPNRIHKY